MRIISFVSSSEWQDWLENNQAISNGVWLQLFKKGCGQLTVSYREAVDQALCYGWIDGQAKSHDAISWIQKFTPRRPQSVWSKINTKHVERLLKLGKMKPAGLAAVEAAKRDGRWQSAYASPSEAVIPEDFLKALSKKCLVKWLVAFLARKR